MTRPNEEDTRAEFLPGTYVSVKEGETLAGTVFQSFYPNLSDIQVTRTENSQLVVAGGTGGLLNLDMNDTASGEGIIPGARVTGVDFVNGVISLGVGNAINVEAGNAIQNPQNSQETRIRINSSAVNTELLRDAIEAADARNEKILISGQGIFVGAEINRGVLNPDSTYDLFISNEDIEDKDEIDSVTIGFAFAASGRTVLNPAVRSFLISGAVETTGNTINLSPAFTNYGSLREGQTVFGDGVAPNTVITKILPGIRQVEVSPGGLPREIIFTGGNIELKDSPSPYFGEGFDHYLQMPDSFNDFFDLSIGQRVSVEGGLNPGSVITGIDPVYRQIGLSSGSVITSQTVTEIEFESIKTVDFGMINKLGSGSAKFSAEPYGYAGTQFRTPRIASGLASIDEGAQYTNVVSVEQFHTTVGTSAVTAGLVVSGVGLNDGYRIQSFNGKDLMLFSATAKSVASSNVAVPPSPSSPSQQTVYRSQIEVDDGFDSFALLKEGMRVSGSAIFPSQANVTISGIDEGNRTLDLDSDIQIDETVLGSGYLIFGEVFKPKFLSSASTKSAFSIHASLPLLNTFIGSENPRNVTRYEVSNEAGGIAPGSLYSLIDIAQNNVFTTVVDGVEANPVITFSPQVQEIQLERPLPEITQRALTIEGKKALPRTEEDGIELLERSRQVSIDGRFLLEDALGNAILPDAEIDGLVIRGENTNGSIVRDVRIGGFDNAAAVRVDGVSDVLLQRLQVGQTDSGTRSGAGYGLYVTGDSTNTTFLDSTVVGSTEAAVRIDNDAIGTQIIGSTLGSSAIINEVGIEVAGSDANVGIVPINPRITGDDWNVLLPRDKNTGLINYTPDPNEDLSYVPYPDMELKSYEASFELGSNIISLDGVSSSVWAEFIPGLAVVGEGLPPESVVVSVDKVNQQLIIDKPASRSVLSDGKVYIGHGATGLATTTTLNLYESVPIDRLFLGQMVRVLGGNSANQSIDDGIITAIDRTNRTVTLSRPLEQVGFYGESARLVEFVEPEANTIESNSIGMVVGLFTSASGSLGSKQLILDQSFSGWQSLRVGGKVVGPGISGQHDVVIEEINEIERTVTLSLPLVANLVSSPIRFDGANGLAVVNTTIKNNVLDGVIIGGGENHSFGEVKELNVYQSRASAESAALQENEQVLELVSWRAVSSLTVSGELNISDSRVSNAIANIATVATNRVTNTQADATTLIVDDDVAGQLQQGFAVIGRGIDSNTTVDAVDINTNTVTLSQPMKASFTGVEVRFLDQDHPDLQKLNVYGSEGLGNSCVVERFDVDSQRIIVSTKGLELNNVELYFGLNQFVVVDPYDLDFTPGFHVEGELLIEANQVSGEVNGIELTLGSGFTDWSRLSYGMSVIGPSIPAETTVVDVIQETRKLILSNPLSGDLDDSNVKFESRVPDYTKASAIRAEFSTAEGQIMPGYLALNTPTEEELNPLLAGQTALEEIRVIQRNDYSNSISANGGFGITVASVESSGQVYGDILATWTLAGNFFDLDLNRGISRDGAVALNRNLKGAISTAAFAKLPIDAGRNLYFSEFSKTDRYGNQYEESLPVQNGGGGEFVEDPITPGVPIDPPDEGEAPEPEDEIWPGFPF